MSRLKPGLLALLYAVLIVYGSTIIGPAGMNYVPLDSTEALHRLLAMPLVNNDSSQRSDWMGNLGSESGAATCTIGTDCRGDVFVVELK